MAVVVSSIETNIGTGTFGPWQEITFTVNFSDVVDVTDEPTLTLNNGGVASYFDGTGTTTLTFIYTVGDTGSGQDIGELAVMDLIGAVLSGADGEPVSTEGFPFSFPDAAIDTTGDVDGDLVLTIFETSINASQNTSVGFGVSGLDGDATADITFSSNGGGDPVVVHVTGNGVSFVNLSGLTDGDISSMLDVTDGVGNHATTFGSPFTLDTMAPSRPGALQLAPEDDSGLSDFDGLTQLTSFLTISGNSDDGSTVSLFEDSDDNGVMDGGETVFATAETVDGSFAVDISLGEGTHHIVTFATDAAGNTGDNSTPLDITIDTTADVGDDLTLVFDHTIIGGADSYAVPFTIDGMDDDVVEALVGFNAGGGMVFAIDASIGVVDLSFFDGRSIDTLVRVTDRAGNTRDVFGPTLQVDASADSDHNLMLTITGNPNIGPAGKGAVEFLISGRDLDVVAAWVVFTDSNGIEFRINDALTNTVADLSYFSDGPFTAELFVSDAAGNTTSVFSGQPLNIDTTADADDPATLTVDRLISTMTNHAVSYTVSGVDDDVATAFVTFTDSLGQSLDMPEVIPGNGTFTVDLSGLADGPITSTLWLYDPAGNSATIAGNTSVLNTTSSISMTINFFRSLGPDAADQLADFAEVIVANTGSGFARLTADEFASFGAAGVTLIHSTPGSLALTMAQYDALGTVGLMETDTVVLRDTGANLAALEGTPAGIIDRLDATDNVLSLTVDQIVWVTSGGPSLTNSDVVTLTGTQDDLTWVSLDLSSLAPAGVDRIDVDGDSLSLGVLQYQALGRVVFADDDTVTLADQSAAFELLGARAFGRFAASGIDIIDEVEDRLVLSVAQYNALNGVALTESDEVTLRDVSSVLAGLDFAAVADGGIDVLDASKNVLSLTVSQYEALSAASLELSGGDVVTLADVGASFAGLDILALEAAGIDKLDATDNVLSLTMDQYFGLGGVTLTSADMVTLADYGTRFAGEDLGPLAGLGIDRIDATGDDTLSLTLGQFNALGRVLLTDSDTVTLADMGGSLQALSIRALGRLAAAGIDRIDADDDQLTLSMAQYNALNGVALSFSDVVRLRDTGSVLAGLDFAAMADAGVVVLDASKNVMSLTVAQYQALDATSIALEASDVVTLADDGANFVGLDFASLDDRFIDRIDATGGLSLTVEQYQDLGGVTLTSADMVTLADDAANLFGLDDFAPLAGRGIDRIDATDDSLSLDLAEFNALGKVLLTDDDAVTVTGTLGDDRFTFSWQTFTDNDKVEGGEGTDTLRLVGDYSDALTFGVGSLSGIERLVVGVGHYDLSVADGAAGAMLAVYGTKQGALDMLSFDGSAETVGSFKFYGGLGTNTFTGGSHSDALVAGSGMDIARYTAASQSLLGTRDTITGFDADVDKFDFGHVVTLDAGASGALSASTMAHVLELAFAGLQDNHAAVFTATGGSYNGSKFLVVDMNDTTGYQADADIIVQLNGSIGTIDNHTFMI